MKGGTRLDPIHQFETYLLADGKAPKTVSSYVSDVRAFHKYLSEHGFTDIQRLTRANITGFKNLLLQQEYKPATINKAINSLNSYTNYLVEQNILPAQVPLVKSSQDRVKVSSDCQHNVEVFTEDELNAILRYVDTPDKLSNRDRLVVYFLLYTGCRVSELCSVKIKDMDLLSGSLRIIGKGGKLREVPLRFDLVEMIQTYIKNERSLSNFSTSEYLFVSQRADRLNRDTVNKVLSKIGAATAMHLYPHKLRHQFCTKLISAGVPLTTVSRLAGHADPATTADYYVNTSRQEKENAVNLL